jgi:serine protease
MISVRSAYLHALSHAKAGQIAGVVPPRGERVKAAPAEGVQAGCAEPNCDLSYGGGAVQHSPHVYLLLWGPDWASSSPAYSDLYWLYDGLGVSPQDTWSLITSQYGDGSGAPSFGTTVFEGAWQDSSVPPDPVTPNDLAAEADGFVTSEGIADTADAQIVIASQSGTCFGDGFLGSCGVPGTTGMYCGWHSITTSGVPFTNLPYQLDAGYECGENFINRGTAGEYDGFTIVAGHEYAETITDPEPFTGWTDRADTISDGGYPGEIADKCIWGGSNWGKLGSDPYGDVTMSTGSFAMQSLWSNAAGRCVQTTSPSLAVSRPGNQAGVLGARARLQVHAVTNTGTALSYKAAGLPPGLSINASSGIITGTPAVTAGTWHPRVTVSDYASSSTVTFAWQVSSEPGQVKGYQARCADDYRNRTRNGNKIDLWSCENQARQRFTFTAARQLMVDRGCVSARSGGLVVLDRCSGSASQAWTRRSNGEYLSDGRCLTYPAHRAVNGTQLRLETCKATKQQRWSVP